MYDAIGKAWTRSKGEILSYLNADEQYLPGTLTTVAATFQQNPQSDAVFGDYILCDTADGHPLAARREIPLRSFYVRHGPLYAMSCTLFFRRRLLESGLLNFRSDLRVVADADLVLRLLDAGVKFHHVSRYLALFGITKDNLSRTRNGCDETAQLRKEQEGPAGFLFRPVARLLRAAEKVISGSYRREHLEYDFCTDETGRVEKITADDVSPRWRWNR